MSGSSRWFSGVVRMPYAAQIVVNNSFLNPWDSMGESKTNPNQQRRTSRKIKMEPENTALQDEHRLPNHHFKFACSHGARTIHNTQNYNEQQQQQQQVPLTMDYRGIVFWGAHSMS